jgi:hypothetical protein
VAGKYAGVELQQRRLSGVDGIDDAARFGSSEKCGDGIRMRASSLDISA